jgi:hypothetical protein
MVHSVYIGIICHRVEVDISVLCASSYIQGFEIHDRMVVGFTTICTISAYRKLGLDVQLF